jgi:thiamine biosynthesis protein ThiI
MPLLRPVVGMDKQEIIEISKRIGAYDISIKPQEDCCSLFVPRKPTAEGKLAEVKEIEKKLKLGSLINKAFRQAHTESSAVSARSINKL